MHFYSYLCKSMLLSEWFNRSLTRIDEVTLTHDIIMLSPGIHALFSVVTRFSTNTHCFRMSRSLGKRETTNLAIIHWHITPPWNNNKSHHFKLGSREPLRHLSGNSDAHSLLVYAAGCSINVSFTEQQL